MGGLLEGGGGAKGMLPPLKLLRGGAGHLPPSSYAYLSIYLSIYPHAVSFLTALARVRCDLKNICSDSKHLVCMMPMVS